ncbi:MAG: DegV family protein [Candidatus Kariarchaeaceae archaeon]
MPSIKIIVDSGSDIPPKLAEKYDIAVIPLYVFFKDDKGIEQVFMDRVEITGENFYDKLVAFKNHPSTAQPSPNDFLELFKKYEEEYDDIIFLSLSNELSGTFSSAHIAQKMINQSKVHLIDSKGASMWYGNMAVLAGELVQKGYETAKIIEIINEAIKTALTVFSVDSLKYLFKGGRIRRTQYLLGSWLSMKPILVLNGETGKIDKFTTVKNYDAMLDEMEKYIVDRYSPDDEIYISAIHAVAPDRAKDIKDRLMKHYPNARYLDSSIGSIIGTHVGPKAFGICALKIPKLD